MCRCLDKRIIHTYTHTYIRIYMVDTEEIKMKWKQYMGKLYKKDPNEGDYYDGVISHPFWKANSSGT